MLPMWVVFSLLSIISATRSTFFLQQYNNLDTDVDIALQIYSLVQAFSKFVIPFLYAWFCCLRKNEKVKIGVGILCGVASCIFAWQLEVVHGTTSISFLWLELADDDSQQNHLREQISDIVQNQDLDNDDQKQHNEDFTNVDCMEQISDTEQNQDLANKDQNKDNEDSTNVGVQQDHCIEQSSDKQK
ncbi:hypothetical protein L1987_12966 [Smallanthus sonchifolius]|uniref:Uncharacterized protein n=1 Tax=Smallanthus sonchifolius TaxID=185202 RepID=A0ACB9JFL7_9ASTR|nr:hypothetical protein L1987_12966 [Smallanthus sonchifolius]